MGRAPDCHFGGFVGSSPIYRSKIWIYMIMVLVTLALTQWVLVRLQVGPLNPSLTQLVNE